MYNNYFAPLQDIFKFGTISWYFMEIVEAIYNCHIKIMPLKLENNLFFHLKSIINSFSNLHSTVYNKYRILLKNRTSSFK